MIRLSKNFKIRLLKFGQQAWFPTVISALVLALAGLGDALIYPALPLFAPQLGVPLIWIGVLLSINKLIRLVGNHTLAITISQLGYKRVAMLGVIFAAASTFIYGLAPPIWMWVLSRITWGMAFAALRLCALGYATENHKQGINLGISKAIKEIGPMSALFIGPILINAISVHAAFQIFGIVTLLALPLTLLLPEDTPLNMPKMKGAIVRPSSFDKLIFVIALADGVLVVTIGLLLLEAGISEATILTLSAFFLAVKRLSVTVVGPISGWLADRYSIHQFFLLSTIGFVCGLCLVSLYITTIGITIIFISSAVNQTLAAGVALNSSSNTKLNTLSALTTWRDLGTALGALAGVYLIDISSSAVIFGGLSILVTTFSVRNGITVANGD